jgi:hypothetical protein
MLSEAYGGETAEKSRFFDWQKRFRVRMSKWQMKSVLITFFDMKGTVHFEFIPQGQTVNWAFYVGTLKQLYETAHRKRPELQPNDWILHHDSATAHKVFPVKQFLAQKSITEMGHPPRFPLFGSK